MIVLVVRHADRVPCSHVRQQHHEREIRDPGLLLSVAGTGDGAGLPREVDSGQRPRNVFTLDSLVARGLVEQSLQELHL
jgi:hypothetical protein